MRSLRRAGSVGSETMTAPRVPTRRRRSPTRRELVLGLCVLVLIALLLDRVLVDRSDHRPGTGSGVAATQARSVAPFTGVDLAGANNVVIRVGAKQSVVVHADDNLLRRVTTRV